MRKFAAVRAAIAGALVATALAGCGGGGDSGPPLVRGPVTAGAVTGNPVGLWNGSMSNGRPIQVLVLPSLVTWFLYSPAGIGAPDGVEGFVQGTLGNVMQDFNASVTNISVSADGVAATSISGTLYDGLFSVTYAGNYDAAFVAAPTLATLGPRAYSGVGIHAGTTVTLDGAGNITGTGGGCNFAGTATPRGDANAYDIAITFGAAPCAAAGQTMNGIGLFKAPTTLSLAVVNAGRTRSYGFRGQ